MSAFLCADDTFDYLATAAAVYGGQYQYRTINETEAADIARQLRDENIRSLQARYPGDWQELTGTAPYAYRPVPRGLLSPVAVLKACACLEYQSCEWDDYELTKAYQLLKQIERAAINALPGYDAAPWGWTRPAPTPADHAADDWDAPTCLRWLAAHTSGPNHYAARADDWDGEVARCAAYEDRTPDEWNETATEELRAAVRAAGGAR